MKLVYVAGPYRAGSRYGVQRNIAFARLVGIQVVAQCLNCYPVIPHMNTAEFDFNPTLKMTNDQFWLDGTLALMKKCDAVLLVRPNADQASAGTASEVAHAELLGIPVFRTLSDLKRWANGETGLCRNGSA